jgi:UDP-N-acetylmuramyl pentapeptide phosphotransferase/UDP-N-acetylglucosamine-1-phosphate transferase
MTQLFVFVISLLLCRLLISRYSFLNILDTPNERSLHEYPTPRTGGVAILISLLMAWCWLVIDSRVSAEILWISGAAFLVAGVSFLDDLQELSPLIRITVHALAAALLIAGGGLSLDGLLGMIVTWLAIIWMLNLYNFMDGMDGFAGGMTLFGFGFLACAGLLQGANEYTMFASLVAAAALGFLCVNFPPAKIFMGDVGSATIGLLAAAFSLWGIRDGLFAWWFPLLVFSPFVVDATVTLIRRALNRDRIWEAHRSHYYQRLVQLGWGHKKTVLAEYVLMLLAGCSALVVLQIDLPVVTALVLIGWSCIYLMVALLVQHYESDAVE